MPGLIEKLSEVDDKLLDPRELSYRLGKPIRRQINALLDNDELDQLDQSELRKLIEREEDNKQLLDYETLTEIHKRLQRLDKNYNDFFFQFVDNCKAMAPKGKQNPELEARLRKLRQYESTQRYGAMTATVSSKKIDVLSNVQSDVQQLRPTLIALINSVLVIAGTFFFVFKAVEYASYEPNISAQILGGLIASTIVAIAELYFIIKIL